MIPLINPNRPPKKWWYRAVKTLSKDRAISDARSLAGWIWFHEMSPKRKAEILLGEKHGGIIDITKTDIQAALHSKHSHSKERGITMSRKRRHARHNAVKWHRPRVRGLKGRFFHAPHSRLFGTGPVKLNRTHRRHRRHLGARFLSNPIRVRYTHTRRNRRHNPKFNLKATFARVTNRRWLMSVATIGGGLVGGMVLKQLLVNLMARSTITSGYTKYAGVGSILIGSLMVGMGKKRVIKEAGVVIAATGLYDLIAGNVPQLGLPILPVVSGPLSKLTMSGSYPVPFLPVSPVAAMAGSYGSPVKSGYSLNGSYQAPSMSTEGFHGDNDPYAGIEW